MLNKTPILIFLLNFSLLFAQNTDAKEVLIKKAKLNFELLKKQPGEVLQNTDQIIKEAKKINAHEAELIALYTNTVYHSIHNEFEKILSSSDLLYEKAKEYDSPAFMTLAKIRSFDFYLLNDLPNEALKELEIANKIISKVKSNDSLIISTKSHLYACYTNYYSHLSDPKNMLKYMKMAVNENKNIPEGEYKRNLQYKDFANLALSFLSDNVDSAKYYAEKSMSLESKDTVNHVKFINNFVLGTYHYKKEQDYEKALQYFLVAEHFGSQQVFLNMIATYQNIIDIYQKLNQPELAEKYKMKLDSLNLLVIGNQKKSLHKIIEKNQEEKSNHVYILGGSLLIFTLVFFYFLRKNKIRKKQLELEYINQEAMIKVNPTKEDYDHLIEKFKNNDPTFMVLFDSLYPEFSQKLIQINPKISQLEIEYSALMKLKVPTKEIAKYKFISVRTVQNKKYHIRKKLNIPENVDIYKWFDGA